MVAPTKKYRLRPAPAPQHWCGGSGAALILDKAICGVDKFLFSNVESCKQPKHWRTINTEEKAKVVAAVWGTESI